MIQRKQSIYLFLAALLNAGVFYFDFYLYHTLATGTDTVGKLRVSDHYPSLLLALVITLLPFITIFLFNNRKLQLRLSFLSVVGIISFISLLLWRVSDINKSVPPPVSGSYWIGAVLPVISLVLVFLAVGGIRKDDKLVKSVDRLR
jgi:hypothetical protein